MQDETPTASFHVAPDWRNGASYRALLTLDRVGWAWEWLKRNGEFRTQLGGLSPHFRREGQVLTAVGDLSSLKAWGVLFRRFVRQGTGVLGPFCAPCHCSARCGAGGPLRRDGRLVRLAAGQQPRVDSAPPRRRRTSAAERRAAPASGRRHFRHPAGRASPPNLHLARNARYRLQSSSSAAAVHVPAIGAVTTLPVCPGAFGYPMGRQVTRVRRRVGWCHPARNCNCAGRRKADSDRMVRKVGLSSSPCSAIGSGWSPVVPRWVSRLAVLSSGLRVLGAKRRVLIRSALMPGRAAPNGSIALTPDEETEQ
ncbi:hypothetical protein FBZ87_1169 [Nitrospirillum amazonense]|uniref:Transcriptional regulator-like domain-containing protein n=1 Tax=Nitrospirillum amazonense TaxID=28077 RepID=A0A560FA21_9PROT|nr:hypothetical protein FBZ89_11079 [Nitrospirillum amazonense]TWB66045.1 hypothetical protein FBZ87_1169 [Nitrospirillum amazonense]